MSEGFAAVHLERFRGPAGPCAVALDFEPAQLIGAWASLRGAMAREVPDGFARDEWAYLISFLEEEHLWGIFGKTFGARARKSDGPVCALFSPVRRVAVWLPNNVSLLGPLTLVLLSLTGTRVALKGGSQSEDLTRAFLAFARDRVSSGALSRWLSERVEHAVFGREDERNAAWASDADVRIVFGSDAAVDAVDALPRRAGTQTIAFRDRSSEAWLDPARIDTSAVRTLLAVFAVYGQAGCTSPRRVVLLGAEEAEARALALRLAEEWPRVVRRDPAPHESSQGLLGLQWARALGWEVHAAPRNAAVFAGGRMGLDPFDVPMGLAVVAASEREALAALPGNIQTIGHLLDAGRVEGLAAQVATRGAARLVPLARMHHFGPVWDGLEFWRRCFRCTEVGT